MSVLRMIDATFAARGSAPVGPFSLTLEAGEGFALSAETSRDALLAARLAAALVKATSGTVLVSDFDPKVQPVQVKRLVGYVPAEPATPPMKNVDDYFRFRADLWEVDRELAVQRGRDVLAQSRNAGAPYAIALAAALIRPCVLLVVDRPDLEYFGVLNRVRENGTAVLATQTGAANAQAAQCAFDARDGALVVQ